MLDEMMLICLMLLLGGHALLIKGCTKITEGIPASTEAITHQFETTSHLLNELCDIIAELTPASQTTMQKSNIGGSIPEMLTTLLMNNLAQSQKHGPTTQSEEWKNNEITDSPKE